MLWFPPMGRLDCVSGKNLGIYNSHDLAMLEQSNMPLKTQDPIDLDPGPCQDRVLRRGFEHRLT